ncbi:MAG: element excision factor XisH family protein, partial [Planktothrix sp.]
GTTPLAQSKERRKLRWKLKVFWRFTSAISEFHTALGQYINYRAALRREEPERILVPELVYNSFFQLDFPASILQENSVKIIVYDIELEQISLWKE